MRSSAVNGVLYTSTYYFYACRANSGNTKKAQGWPISRAPGHLQIPSRKRAKTARLAGAAREIRGPCGTRKLGQRPEMREHWTRKHYSFQGFTIPKVSSMAIGLDNEHDK